MMNAKFELKNILEKISAQIIALAVVLAVVFFFLLNSLFVSYTSTTTILVSEKSQMAAAQHEQIVANITALPTTLSFYDRMLKANPDVRDVSAGKSSIERLQAWNQMLTTQNLAPSSLVTVSISTSQKNDAEQLDAKTVRALLDTTSFYYDIKNDVDLRVVDGPITVENHTDWQWSLLISILLSVGIVSLLKYAWLLGKYFPSKKEQTQDENFQEPIQTEVEEEKINEDLNFEFEQEKKEEATESVVSNKNQSPELEYLNKIIEQDTYPNYPEMPTHHTKASAPDNLPIADDMFYDVQEVEKKEEEIPQAKNEQKTGEPTPEELKERLNQLLRGEL